MGISDAIFKNIMELCNLQICIIYHLKGLLTVLLLVLVALKSMQKWLRSLKLNIECFIFTGTPVHVSLFSPFSL